MDELDIKGRRYISSKRASQITGYAKDYVGQLAREGRIVGTRVGRAWYLDEASILEHAKTDFSGVPFSSSVVEASNQVYVPKNALIDKESVLPSTWGSIRYMEDDRDLIPELKQLDTVQVEEANLNAHQIESRVSFPVFDELVVVQDEVPDLTQDATEEEKVVIRRPSLHVAGLNAMGGIDGTIEPRQIANVRVTTFRTASNYKRVTRRGYKAPLLSAYLFIAAFSLFFFVTGLFATSKLSIDGANIASASLYIGYDYVSEILSKPNF
jgi:hypothetical protein